MSGWSQKLFGGVWWSWLPLAALSLAAGCGGDSPAGSPSLDPMQPSDLAGQGAGPGPMSVMETPVAPTAQPNGAQVPPSTTSVAPNPDAPASVESPTTTATDSDAWCGALSVFRSSCQGCHGNELVGGAPMPLVSYDDFMAPALSDPQKKVHELIGPRIHDTARPMPPLSQTALNDPDMTAVDTWLSAGVPAPQGECTGIAEAPTPSDELEPEWPADCEERYEIRAQGPGGGPYVVPADSELNIDIDIPVPWTGGGTVQALAIRPIKSNKRVVHHWILYAGAFDFITSWSPGKPMEVFPDDVGVHMPSSGNFRLNMHYYNVGNPQAEEDQSGLEVCITRTPRPNTATTYMFTGSATVPAASKVDNVSTCTVSATEPVHIITSSPHMHSYGVASKLEVLHADGSIDVLEDGPFNWQDQHVTPVDAVVNNGDRVRMTCSYENNTSSTIRFGSSSEDEMCFNFARYYPMGAFRCTGGGFF